ncbi:MAG TPA: hypothetical protein VN618_04750 [Solirubrobacteraceae bacterium]|nr:hypothetical protein [Solirubrobacteraceae bacterium]
MTANIGFALTAAVLSLAIVIGAALKGHWVVAVVYGMLVAGFLARAGYGRAARRGAASPGEAPEQAGDPDGARQLGPRHAPERELRRARFRRR